jgi:hypothetical protein
MRAIRAFSIACAFLMSTSELYSQAPQDLQGFSVVLLVGETQGTAVPEGLSAPARKALSDMKEFLPYKAYRALDTQWLAGTMRTPLHMQTRLRGLDNQEYEFTMEGFPPPKGISPDARLTAMLRLQIAPINKATRDAATARLSMLEAGIRSGPQQAEADREVRQLRQMLSAGQMLLNTTVSLGIGETIVAGTSRVQGDRALIVLLTAVSRAN